MWFNHPYFFILFLLPFLFLVFKARRFFLYHPYVASLKSRSRNFRFDYKILNWIGWTLLIIASVDLSWSYLENREVFLVHKYVLINDASGSMVDFLQDNGVGKDLKILIDANERFLSKVKESESQNYVGLIFFSDFAFIASDFVDDPEFISKKLSRVDYRRNPLGSGTNITDALWGGLMMALDEKKYDSLEIKMYGSDRRINDDSFLREIIEKKSSVAKGTSLIIFTDGFFFNTDGTPNALSAFKILDFCRMIGIRVYFISVFSVNEDLNQYIKDTGGEVIVEEQISNSNLDRVYTEIFENQANEIEVQQQQVDTSFSGILASIALIFLIFGIILQNTANRNFTEV